MYDQTIGINRGYYHAQGPIPSLPPGGGMAPTIYEYRLEYPHASGRVSMDGKSYLVGPIAPYPAIAPSAVGGGQRYLPGPIPHHPEYPGGLSLEGMGGQGYDMGDVSGNRYRFGRMRVGSYITPPSVGSTLMY